MKCAWLTFGVAFLVFGAGASAQQHLRESAAQARHHGCLEQERRAMEEGNGFGLALAADRNGFPGPEHILQLRYQLQLAPEQEEQVQSLFERMRVQARATAKKLLAKEAALERLFASGTVDPGAARRLVEESAALRAELRWVHLAAHLQAYGLLSAEQRARYQELRHGARPASP